MKKAIYHPNPDKPEPKGISRKAAKDAKEIFKFWIFKRE